MMMKLSDNYYYAKTQRTPRSTIHHRHHLSCHQHRRRRRHHRHHHQTSLSVELEVLQLSRQPGFPHHHSLLYRFRQKNFVHQRHHFYWGLAVEAPFCYQQLWVSWLGELVVRASSWRLVLRVGERRSLGCHLMRQRFDSWMYFVDAAERQVVEALEVEGAVLDFVLVLVGKSPRHMPMVSSPGRMFAGCDTATSLANNYQPCRKFANRKKSAKQRGRKGSKSN